MRIFVDGGAGTTGLEIVARLRDRRDVALAVLPDEARKDVAARRAALAEADIAILCLPDDAAREAVALAAGMAVRFIDASTAHRVDPAWVYGFPELAPGQRERIAAARLVANPGCYPTGFLALVAPLVRAGLLPAAAPVTVNAVSGYSGGGKAMIADFEGGGADTGLRSYALSLAHKHVPEMRVQAGLVHPPLFAPAVARSYRGMLVEVPLHLSLCTPGTTPARLHAALADAYADSVTVTVAPLDPDAVPAGLDLEHVGASDRIAVFVFANPQAGHVRLIAALDNLGKGAAGAAVQNLNLMAGLDETAGLRL